MSIVEQIKKLPKGFHVRGYQTNSRGVTTETFTIANNRLIALAESHERLLKAAKDARDGIDLLDYDQEYEKANEIGTTLQAAIEEAEKL